MNSCLFKNTFSERVVRARFSIHVQKLIILAIVLLPLLCGPMKILYRFKSMSTIVIGPIFSKCRCFIDTILQFCLQNYCFFLKYASIWAKIVFECAIFRHFVARSYVGFLGFKEFLFHYVQTIIPMFARAAHLLLRMSIGHSRCALTASRSSVGHVVEISAEQENKLEKCVRRKYYAVSFELYL